MNVVFIVTYTIIITLALWYGVYKHRKDKREHKDFINSLTREEYQEYKERIDEAAKKRANAKRNV